MTIFTKLSTLIASSALLSLAAYSNTGFAHPPGGHDMPKKYRTMDQPETQSEPQPEIETEPSVAPPQDHMHAEKKDAAKLSKECRAMMINMKAEIDEGGKSVDIKDMEAKIKKCIADTKTLTAEEK